MVNLLDCNLVISVFELQSRLMISVLLEGQRRIVKNYSYRERLEN